MTAYLLPFVEYALATVEPSDVLLEQVRDPARPLYGLCLRFLAVFSLVMGLAYWGQLTGFWGDGASRFDLLSVNSRMALGVLAVTFPFAALGLWFKSSWGIVLWLSCAFLQLALYGLWSDTYGARPTLLAFIAGFAIVLAGFHIWFVIFWRRHRLTAY